MRKALLLMGVGLLACGSGDLVTSGDPGAGGGGATGTGTSAGSTAAGTGAGTSTGSTGTGTGTTCGSTAGVQCDYAYSGFNSSASVNTNSTVTWSCSGTTRS